MGADGRIDVLCADDHPLVRKGIAWILAAESDIHLVAEAGTGQEALELFRIHVPDVTLIDLRMPGMDGIAATEAILREFPDAKIIALTSYAGDQEIYRTLKAGVQGYLLKEMVHTEVVRAIRTVHSGKRLMPAEVSERLAAYLPQPALTPREEEVLSLIAKGLGNKEVADQLGTSDGTVRIHVQHILAKLGASDRTHAVSIALQRGILRVDG
ncbi:MAG TPA: response regulator transcription factor [Terriglobia bacterium]|jgi:DNA-binding NarL/FixJ family response regulator